MKDNLYTIGSFLAQGALYILGAYLLIRQKFSNLKKSEAEAEKTIGESYAQLLKEYRDRTSEQINTLNFQYEQKISELRAEVLRLSKKIDELQDDINAEKTINARYKESLDKAIEDKEYFRGQYHGVTKIIDKHLKTKHETTKVNS